VEVLASGRAPGPASVEALYRRYSRDVLALAHRTVGCRSDAEDVAQTTFLNAHRAMARGARPANERAWLLEIARNVCRHRFRSLAQRPTEEPLDEWRLPSSGGAAAAAPGVLDALGTLPPRQREAIVLQAVHGYSTAEIGERIGLAPSGVDALLFRARSALREELGSARQPVDCASTPTLVERQRNQELGDREQAALRAHLRTCSGCASRARSIRARKRLASILVLPWHIVSRLAGSAGSAGVGVKAATVLAIAVGAAATDRAVLAGKDPEPAAPTVRTAVTRAETSSRTPPLRATPTRASAPTASGSRTHAPLTRPPQIAAAAAATALNPGVRVSAQPTPGGPTQAPPTPRPQPAAPQPAVTPETPLREVPLPAPVTDVVDAVEDAVESVVEVVQLPTITTPELPVSPDQSVSTIVDALPVAPPVQAPGLPSLDG
jgi:RNA polymerase sigma factor (sigma-70 family)